MTPFLCFALMTQSKIEFPYNLPRVGQEGSLKLEEAKGKRGIVLFFVNEQCGVTYYYNARIAKIQKDFEPLGFAFVGVRTGKKQHPDQPVELAEAKALKMPFVDDAEGDLQQKFNIGQSLTFVVLDGQSNLRYQGGFDDHVSEAKVKRSYLRDALRAVAQGKLVPKNTAPTMGCAIIPVKSQ